jgi:hypothetical protein
MSELKQRVFYRGEMYFFGDPSEWDIEDYSAFYSLMEKGGKRDVCTSLSDKNGKDIYEGDVLDELEAQGRVAPYVVSIPDIYYMEEAGARVEEAEIIGNIHQDSHLLTQEER